MENNSSYKVNSISSSMELEIKRLQAQVNLFWEKEVKHYKEFGMVSGMKIVELGCGPGFVLEKLNEEFDDVELTGVEIDDCLVEYAKKNLEKHKNITVQPGSILDINLPDNTYDFAIARLVIEHLDDPIAAIKEVTRILKPGGKAIFVDNDFEMHIECYPEIIELRDLYDAYCTARVQENGNPKIGRLLPLLLKKGGLSNIDIEVIVAHSELIGDEAFLKSEGVGIPSQLVKCGLLSSKTMGKISVKWRQMLRSEEHVMLRQLYLCVGEKLVCSLKE